MKTSYLSIILGSWTYD